MEWNLIAAVIALAVLIGLFRMCLVRHVVSVGHVGLLYRNEVFAEELKPGRYFRFDPLKRQQLVTVLTLPTALNPNQLEVISKDQFAFRMTVSPFITIIEPREFHEGTPPVSPDMAGFYAGPEMRFSRLGPVLSHAVMAAVASKTLEEFMADPTACLDGVARQLGEVLPGTQLDQLAITSITLPPEVRKMFTEVERARREGLAGLERSKAEQASLRALANAARNLAGNPQLAQLRVLQTMESAKGAKTFVLGNPAEAVPTDGDAST